MLPSAVDQVVFFDGFVDLIRHALQRFFRRLISVDHFLDFRFDDLSGLGEYAQQRARVLRSGVVQLVNGGLELGILGNVVFESLLLCRVRGHREVAGLGVPVSLGLRRNQELDKFPGSRRLFLVLVVQRP